MTITISTLKDRNPAHHFESAPRYVVAPRDAIGKRFIAGLSGVSARRHRMVGLPPTGAHAACIRDPARHRSGASRRSFAGLLRLVGIEVGRSGPPAPLHSAARALIFR